VLLNKETDASFSNSSLVLFSSEVKSYFLLSEILFHLKCMDYKLKGIL